MTKHLLLAALAAGSLLACGGAPSIPHPISSESESYCLTCHKDGTQGAPRTPHPDRKGCTGCHTP